MRSSDASEAVAQYQLMLVISSGFSAFNAGGEGCRSYLGSPVPWLRKQAAAVEQKGVAGQSIRYFWPLLRKNPKLQVLRSVASPIQAASSVEAPPCSSSAVSKKVWTRAATY